MTSNDLLPPDLIASGLGLAARDELCGLIALLDTVSIFEAMRGIGEGLGQKLGADLPTAADRMAITAARLSESGTDDAVLRHRLWVTLAEALGAPDTLPLSERRLSEEAAALGVLAARDLSPGIRARIQLRARTDEQRAPIPERVRRRAREIASKPGQLWQKKDPLLFPQVVAYELAELLDGIDLDGTDENLDPRIVDVLRRGGTHGWAALAAAGGWMGLAAAVNGAGFAPYILAAKASAFLPFLGGPAAVSFLAVMVNPLTIAAGLLALGLGGQRIGNIIRAQTASRIAVLLAVRGQEDRRNGLGCLASDFRSLCAPGAQRPAHVSPTRWKAHRSRMIRLESVASGRIEAAPGSPPRDWSGGQYRKSQNDALETLATLGLTAADMLHNAAAIDPRVVAGADFWRSADIGNPLEFAQHAANFALHGSDIALRGYTAEQFVLGKLIEDGHHVALPGASNNPGFDLIVDGNPVQVKCAQNMSQLEDHFDKYPDIPVIANAELAAQAAYKD